MTTTTIQTIDKRARTSDGKAQCAGCGHAIRKGDIYTQETNAATGMTLERNICKECQLSGNRGDTTITVVVVGAVAVTFANQEERTCKTLNYKRPCLH